MTGVFPTAALIRAIMFASWALYVTRTILGGAGLLAFLYALGPR